MKAWHCVLAAMMLASLAGCTAVAVQQMEAPIQSPTTVAVNITETELVTGTLAMLDSSVEKLVSIAKAQLTAKFGIAPEAVTVFSVDAAQRPDGGLGCVPDQPLEGDASVAGYVLLLEAGGQVYTFRTDETDRVVLCDAAGPGEIYQPP